MPLTHSPTSKLHEILGLHKGILNTKQTMFIAHVNVGLYLGEKGVISKSIH